MHPQLNPTLPNATLPYPNAAQGGGGGMHRGFESSPNLSQPTPPELIPSNVYVPLARRNKQTGAPKSLSEMVPCAPHHPPILIFTPLSLTPL